MLFEERFWAGLADGSTTVAFRRWRRPTVRAGGTLRTPRCILDIESVTAMTSTDDISDVDAGRAGFDSRAELLQALERTPRRRGATGDTADGPPLTLYRVEFAPSTDADPRELLRAANDLTESDVAELVSRLARLDARSPEFAWTRPVLRHIGDHPGTVSSTMADDLACDRVWLKRKVTALKKLGLTISLERGYELSPRGRAFLESTAE